MKIAGKPNSTRPFINAIVLIALLCLAAPKTHADNTNLLPGEDQAAVNIESISSPTLPGGDELLMFADMPIVISASRSEQPINWSSIPISLITSDDIHYSGQTRIEEVLRYVPGIDIIRLNRRRYAIGVHGLHDYFSDRTLTLIDGRSAESPMFGGSEFYRQPLFMEDIARVEVMRGPGGAAWGANAFNGVINIITKKPEECLGWFVNTTWSEFGDSANQVRWAGKKGLWRWMASAGYEGYESSEDALHHAHYETLYPNLANWFGYGNYAARDFARQWKFDFKGYYNPSEETEVSFGQGYSVMEGGDFEFIGYYPMENCHMNTSRSFVKIDHQYDADTHGYLQWFGNFARTDDPSLLTYETRQNDLEAQFNFSPVKDHQVTVGGNFRWFSIDASSSGSQEFYYVHEPYNEFWVGAFAMDNWQATDRLQLQGQVRGDWYSETQTDYAARLTALYALDEQKQHVFRLGGARAFRTPYATLRDLVGNRVAFPSPPFPPNTYVMNLLAPEKDLKNEEVASVEIGYTGRLNHHVTVRADGYYQRYEKLIGYQKYVGQPFGNNYLTPDNIDGAAGWGAECEIILQGEPGSLSAWYAYNDIRRDSDQNVRTFLPAVHKTGINARLYLPLGLVFNTNYRFTSLTQAGGTNDESSPIIEPTHHWDMALSKKILDDRGEIMVGVSDLLTQVHEPYYGAAQFAAHETPGRMFFARVQLKF